MNCFMCLPSRSPQFKALTLMVTVFGVRDFRDKVRRDLKGGNLIL